MKEFNSMNFKEMEKKGLQYTEKDIIQSASFIVAKLGYSPFIKFPIIYIKDEKDYSVYYNVSAFIRNSLNFFNYICAIPISNYLKITDLNNFGVRLQQYGLIITKGKEFLFNKSYITQQDPDDMKILSSNVSQLRNFLYAKDNPNQILLKKIKWDQFDMKFISFRFEEVEQKKD